jgi:hypothetical protein
MLTVVTNYETVVGKTNAAVRRSCVRLSVCVRAFFAAVRACVRIHMRAHTLTRTHTHKQGEWCMPAADPKKPFVVTCQAPGVADMGPYAHTHTGRAHAHTHTHACTHSRTRTLGGAGTTRPVSSRWDHGIIWDHKICVYVCIDLCKDIDIDIHRWIDMDSTMSIDR